ncbi:MAG: alkaline phosphatase family protein [Nitrospinota bacterium]|nr:alkaline phosphatase family protein [Nitrospinota bacterium]
MTEEIRPFKRKAFIFSLDGASFSLLEKIQKYNVIPFLSKLMESGSKGELESTNPPLTPTAWTSIFSGLNPGKHGIFDFILQDANGNFNPINSSFVDGKMLWDHAGKAGKKVVILNQPITYPVHPVNGIIVSDHIFTPRRSNAYAYPENFIEVMESDIGRFKIFNNVTYADNRIDAVLNDYFEELEYKMKAFEYIDNRLDWDLFILYFWSLDHIQHSMLHILDDEHPKFNRSLHDRYMPAILEYFKKLDSTIQNIYLKVIERSVVLFVSDHGLSGLAGFVHLNTWLLQKGYIRLLETPKVRIKKILFDIGFTPENMYKLANRFFIFKQGMPMLSTSYNKLIGFVFLSFSDVNWNETIAFAKGNFSQIFLNRKRNNKSAINDKDILERLKNDLLELTNEKGDERIVDKVFLKHDIYTGDYTDSAQDILFYTKNYEYKALGTLDFNSNRSITDTFAITGHHNHSGIFICKGDGIKKSQHLQNLKDEDVFPTVLKILGIPVPKGIDGRIIKEIFENQINETPETDKVDDTPSIPKTPKGQDIYSKEEKEDISKRLKDLGYM